jgi:hypothetical protein
VERTGKERKVYTVLAGKEEGHSENRCVDWRMVSEWILGRLAGMCGMDPTGSE